MKVVAKFSLLLGGTLTAVSALIGFVRIGVLRSHLEEDMRHDNLVVGHVLQSSVGELWRGASPRGGDRVRAETVALLERSSREFVTTHFEWQPATHDRDETQQMTDHELVSTFPVIVDGNPVGAIVAREPLAVLDHQVRVQLWFSVFGVAAVAALSLAAALLLGGWLVGRPIGLLVEQARRIGRRELTSELVVRRRDELGELAVEMTAATNALRESLARGDAESEARLRAVEQVRHADRLATVGKLAAGVAHELGTPLSIVGGHAQMIASGEVVGARALASARAIDAEVARMSKIVRQLLDFARRKGPEGATCEPGEVARRCVALLAVMTERNYIKCTVTDRSNGARVTMDEDNLQQIFTNLMVNAIDAMPSGGTIAIAIARANASPSPGLAATPCVEITVADTGNGIAAEVQSTLFEPFVTTKAPGEGTGLGLAVVHGIVTDHRGWITVDSAASGTTFAVFLAEAT